MIKIIIFVMFFYLASYYLFTTCWDRIFEWYMEQGLQRRNKNRGWGWNVTLMEGDEEAETKDSNWTRVIYQRVISPRVCRDFCKTVSNINRISHKEMDCQVSDLRQWIRQTFWHLLTKLDAISIKLISQNLGRHKVSVVDKETLYKSQTLWETVVGS